MTFSRRARRFCALGVTLWAATAAARQAHSGILPAELRAHLQNGRFDAVTSVRGLPLGVRNDLQALFGSPTLDIAEPGMPIETTGGSAGSAQARRRLVAAACSYTDCVVYYERIGAGREWRVMLFHWTPDATKLEWAGNTSASLTTIEAVRSAVLSGAITGSNGPW